MFYFSIWNERLDCYLASILYGCCVLFILGLMRVKEHAYNGEPATTDHNLYPHWKKLLRFVSHSLQRDEISQWSNHLSKFISFTKDYNICFKEKRNKEQRCFKLNWWLQCASSNTVVWNIKALSSEKTPAKCVIIYSPVMTAKLSSKLLTT